MIDVAKKTRLLQELKWSKTKKFKISRLATIVGFFIFTLLFLSGSAQVRSPEFVRLTTNEGLSQGHVTAILKDSKGFMWFGTHAGLNKYDGYKFTAYKNEQENPSSISNNILYDILEDHEQNLWVATHVGVDKFNRAKDSFVHYHPGNLHVVNAVFEDSRQRIWAGTEDGIYVLNRATDKFERYKTSKEASGINEDYVFKIAEDTRGYLWIATREGLKRFSPESGQYFCYRNDPGDNSSIGSDLVRAVYKDSRGNVWAGTQGGGIALYNYQSNSFTNYRHDRYRSNSIAHNDILSLCEDAKGNLWVGTENGGISVFNASQKSFANYKNDPNNSKSLSNNSIYSLFRDNFGTMWIGTYSEGVNFLPVNGDKFERYTQNLADRNSLNDNSILSICGDSTGDIWIGTDGGGLNRFNQKTQVFTHYLNDFKNKNSINSNYVLSVIEIDKNLLALGLHRGGLDFFNTKTGVFTHHVPEKGNANSISTLAVNILYKSRDGNVWIGTWGSGLDYYDRKKNKFTHYENSAKDTNTIVNNFIYCIFEDSKGDLWVGSADGLDRLNRKTNSFTHYHHSDTDKKSISQNFVQHIFEDHNNNLWLGTTGGLNLFDRKSETFIAYTEKNGIANNTIQSILEDGHGNLWLATNNGLTKFNPANKAVRNYDPSDGLQGKEFKANSCYQSSDGQMFFGGTNGFNSFYPDSLKDNTFLPPVYLTGFNIFNKEVTPGVKGSALRQSISEAKNIMLSYKQSVFSFEFAALNYILPQKNQYAYRLENFDKDWNYSHNTRTATYTNLDPGKYVFRVKGSNNDGFWNETGTAVTITILPPYWMTWWFKTAVGLLVIGGAAGFYLFRMNIVKSQKRMLEQTVRKQTAQLVTSNEEERKARLEADEANRAKSVFLATMSHEIRTPMNGVMGMASLLMQTRLTPEQQTFAKTITTCGESLLSVINSILDFSKIESGKMELENKLFNIADCIEESLNIFSFKASETGLKLSYHINRDVPAAIVGDSLRLRQILINLVGNAMKFTAAGEVFISVNLLETEPGEAMKICFKVRDTGIGIPAEKMERLFKAFSQVDSSTTRQYGGTGLGLVICEKLVTLMGGKITVESEPGNGTAFTFFIQTSSEVENEASNNFAETSYSHKNAGAGETEDQSFFSNLSLQYPLNILVAEDNAVNLIIITKVLDKLGYKPEVAKSGLEAINKLKQKDFDLIFMDVQMPEMDGLEATAYIRKNLAPQPVIIAMTAHAMQGDRDECLAAGMNDYMSKPINFTIFQNMLNTWAGRIYHNKASIM